MMCARGPGRNETGGWCRARSRSPPRCSSTPPACPTAAPAARLRARRDRGQRRLLGELPDHDERPRRHQRHQRLRPGQAQPRRAPRGELGASRTDGAHDPRRPLQRQDRRPGTARQQRRPARLRGSAHRRHRGRPRRADLRRPADRRHHGRRRPLQGVPPARAVVARAGALLRARPRRDAGRPRRRARAGRDARDLRPSPAPHAPRPARRVPRARGGQLSPDRDPRRAAGPAPWQLRDARHGRRPGGRHLPGELCVHQRRAGALRLPPARAPLPALPVLPGLLAPGERLRRADRLGPAAG